MGVLDECVLFQVLRQESIEMDVSVSSLTLGEYVTDVIYVSGLAPGEYCEVIHNCEYKVKVNDQGRAYVNMSADYNPILAILNRGMFGFFNCRHPQGLKFCL